MSDPQPPNLLAACMGGGFFLIVAAGLVLGAFARLTS